MRAGEAHAHLEPVAGDLTGPLERPGARGAVGADVDPFRGERAQVGLAARREEVRVGAREDEDTLDARRVDEREIAVRRAGHVGLGARRGGQ